MMKDSKLFLESILTTEDMRIIKGYLENGGNVLLMGKAKTGLTTATCGITSLLGNGMLVHILEEGLETPPSNMMEAMNIKKASLYETANNVKLKFLGLDKFKERKEVLVVDRLNVLGDKVALLENHFRNKDLATITSIQVSSKIEGLDEVENAKEVVHRFFESVRFKGGLKRLEFLVIAVYVKEDNNLTAQLVELSI